MYFNNNKSKSKSMKKLNFYNAIMTHKAFAEYLKFGRNGDESYLDRNHPHHNLIVDKFSGREVRYDPILKRGEVMNNVAYVTNVDRSFEFHLNDIGEVILDPRPNSKMNQKACVTLNQTDWPESKVPTLGNCGFTAATKLSWAHLIKKAVSILYAEGQFDKEDESQKENIVEKSVQNSAPNIISPEVINQSSFTIDPPRVTRNMKAQNLIKVLMKTSPIFLDEKKSIENKLKNLLNK